MRAILGTVALLVAGPAVAEVMTVRYLCERGVEIPATYVNADGMESVAVIHVEGEQITLSLEPSASGARYGWPSGGSNYVWWTKGDAATLYWRDGETTIEETIYAECLRRE
jgi:membrane-bound inhibitor of C-type lysozyme